MKFLSLLAITSFSSIVSARWCNGGTNGNGRCEQLDMYTFCCSVNGETYGEYTNWKGNAWTTTSDPNGDYGCGGWVNGVREGAIYCSK